ncbi:MAG: phosphatase PAP2 family protein [Deltaproteobacteria bacterium]|nr:phosphatase PAP2 family protein [Deltaproteobacteria bacterium]
MKLNGKSWAVILGLTVFFVLGYFCENAFYNLVRSSPGSGLHMFGEIGYQAGIGLYQAMLCICLAAAGIVYKYRPCLAAGVRGILSVAASGLGVQIVKHLIGRPRPRLWAAGITHWGPSLKSGFESFPSGHTATSFALATVLAYHFPRASMVFYSLAGLVALSRAISGAHFLTDLAGGMALGLIVGQLWKSYWRSFFRRPR